MSLMDQAFIKAYAKDSPPVRESAAPAPVAPAAQRVPLVERAQPTTRDHALPAIEQLYSNGTLYRLDATPPAGAAPSVPAPHYGVKVPQPSRRASRRMLDRPSAEENRERAPASPASTNRPPRRSFTRSLLGLAQKVEHPALPALPQAAEQPVAEQSPETICDPHRPEQESPPRPQLPVFQPETAPELPPAPPTSWNVLSESASLHADWEMLAAPTQVVLPEAHDFEVTAALLEIDWVPPPAATMPPAATAAVVSEPAPIAQPEPQPEPPPAEDTTTRRFRLDAAHAPAVPEPHLEVAKIAEPAAEVTPEPIAAEADEPAHPVALPLPDREQESSDEYELAAAAEVTPVPQAAPPETPKPPCVPLWEVDRFLWPETCDKLMRDEQSYFNQAGGKLLAAARDGLKTLAITGSRRGEGRTTLALCLARCAAAAGIQVALIDADFARPQLASMVGLEVAYGWQDAALGKIPLAEAAVKSLADKITILPLEAATAGAALALDDPRVTATLRAAAATFELVIVDLGPTAAGHGPLLPTDERCPLDAVIVVRDMRYATAAESAAVGQRLYAAGVDAVGIAENFVQD